jgi:hypothetical protein
MHDDDGDDQGKALKDELYWNVLLHLLGVESESRGAITTAPQKGIPRC